MRIRFSPLGSTKMGATPLESPGAGDTWRTSMPWATRDLEQALRQAVRYAAYSITRPGTQKSYAGADEFSAFCATLPEA